MAHEITEKTCSACKEVKPLDQFHKNASHISTGRANRCKPCAIAVVKAWVLANPEKKRKNAREWGRRNPEVMKVTAARNAAAKPEQYKAMRIIDVNSRRAKAAGVESSFTREEWLEMQRGCGYTCLACGATNKPLTIDHVVAMSRGGPNVATNIQPLCSTCNKKKWAHTIDYRKVA